jgi:hypothetical protein
LAHMHPIDIRLIDSLQHCCIIWQRTRLHTAAAAAAPTLILQQQQQQQIQIHARENGGYRRSSLATSGYLVLIHVCVKDANGPIAITHTLAVEYQAWRMINIARTQWNMARIRYI